MDTDQAKTEIQIAIENLEPHALFVLLEIAQRMVVGQAEYGALNLDTDTRDFHREAHEEDMDSLVYRTMDFVKKRLDGVEA